MDEDKNKKPLLSYEQVIEIIDERVSRDEADGRVGSGMQEEGVMQWKEEEKTILLKVVLRKTVQVYKEIEY